MIRKTFFLIPACAALLFGCSTDLPPSQYLAWMAKNRDALTTAQQQGLIVTSLAYLPADWLALNEVGPDHLEQIAATCKQYEGLQYYRLRVALNSGQGDVLQFGAGSTDEYYQRVEYFSFGLQNDLHLLAGADTLPCKLFHFERNYGAAPYIDFMLGFEEKTDNHFDRTVIYDDRVYSDSLIRLTIPAERIQQIPSLK